MEDSESGKSKVVPFARMYTVFNVSQCDNLPAEKLKRPAGKDGFDTAVEQLVREQTR